jgi:hypothetical protein
MHAADSNNAITATYRFTGKQIISEIMTSFE